MNSAASRLPALLGGCMWTRRGVYFRVCLVLLAGLTAALVVMERPVKMEKRIAERRERDGKEPPTHWLVEVWAWRGLAVNTGLAAALLALAPLAGRPLRGSAPLEGDGANAPPLGGRGWLLLGLACALHLHQSLPRLDHSLWGDEEYTMRAYIAPDAREVDGQWELTPRSWSVTLWGFTRPNNHLGYTWVARMFHDTFFQPGAGQRDGWFSERWMRAPVLLASLAALGALVWCARVWGLAAAAPWLAVLLAGHAWMARYGSDARGYGFILLLMPLLMGALGRALQTMRWRWWLAFAFFQFYLVWTHTGVMHALLAANAVAGMVIWARGGSNRLALTGRWLASGLASVMAAVAVMGPVLEPFRRYMRQNALPGELDSAWFQDAWASLVTGVPWIHWGPGNPLCASLSGGPWPWWLAAAGLAVFAAAALAGLAWLCRGRDTRWLAAALLGGPLLLLAHLWASGTRPYHWYLIPYLPGLLLLWGACWEAGGTARLRAARVLAGVAMLAVLGFAQPSVALLMSHPVEACRESVALTRAVTNPRHPDYGRDAITAAPGMSTEAYDPAVRKFGDAAALRSLMDEAESEGLPLFINFGARGLLERAMPEVFAVLNDERQFERAGKFWGQFGPATREVLRWRGR